MQYIFFVPVTDDLWLGMHCVLNVAEVSPSEHVHDSKNDGSLQNLSGEVGSEGLKKNQ